MAHRRGRKGGEKPAQAKGARRPARPDEMEDLRRRIDAIDRRMVRLLNDRAGCAIALGRVKKKRGLPIYQPAREEEVLGNVQRTNGGPLQKEALRRLFLRIIDESRRIERSATEGSGAPAADQEGAPGPAGPGPAARGPAGPRSPKD
ncbi:MAG: chorismate mutase [Acidobacteria bacterium]|nr:chorismate mutase [Acidobacteriota bacterium]